MKMVVFGGLAVGILDGAAAVVNAYISHGIGPERVFQYIASKGFGPEAFSGRLAMAFMGLFFHFLIAFSWTIIFIFMYPRINSWTKNKFLIAIGYGLFVWLIMNVLVIPFIDKSFHSFGTGSVIGMLIHIFFVGLPLTLIISNYYSRNK